MSIFEKSKSYRPFKYERFVQLEKERRVGQFWHENQVELADDIRQYNSKDGLKTANVSHEDNKKIIDRLLMLFTEMDANVATGYTRLLPHVGNNEVRTLMITNASREVTHQRAYALAAEAFGYTASQWRGFHQYKEMTDKIDIILQDVGDLSIPLNFAKYLVVILLGEGISLFGAFACLLNLRRFGILMGFNQVNSWSLIDEYGHVSDNIEILNCIKEEDLSEEENKELDRWIEKIVVQYVQAELLFFDLVFEDSDQEGMTKHEAKDYIRYLGNMRLQQLGRPKLYMIDSNPLPWMDYVLSGSQHTNFFEARVTDYAHTGLIGDSETSKWKSKLEQRMMGIGEEEGNEKKPSYVVYGGTHCPNCARAVQLLKSKEAEYHYIDIHHPDNVKHREYILRQGLRSIPQVYKIIGDEKKHIGGYVDLVNAL